MRVTPVSGVGQVWQVGGVSNNSAIRRIPALGGALSQQRQDSVSISPQGRMSQMMQAISEQKRGVVEQKNSLIAKTLEKGDSLDTIEAQLDAFEEKLQTLDESLSTLQQGQVQQLAEGLKNEKQDTDAPETEEEEHAAEMGRLSGMAADLDQAKTISSATAKTQGEARVLEWQIESDSERVRIKNPHPGDNAAGTQYIGDKRAKLTGMREKANAAYQQFAGALQSAQEAAPTAAQPLEAAEAAAEDRQVTQAAQAEEPAANWQQERQAPQQPQFTRLDARA